MDVHFRNGFVVFLSPMRGSLYESKSVLYETPSFLSDGIRYYLNDIDSVNSIPVPRFKSSSAFLYDRLGCIGCLDYFLRVRATHFWQDKQYDLALACLRKAMRIMPSSPVEWQKKDYYRIVHWLQDLGRFDTADRFTGWIDRNIPDDSVVSWRRTLASCKEFNSDLCYIEWHNCSCSVCAKYQGRVYSISGKDRRFPPLPDHILKTGSIHAGCKHVPRPFVFLGDRTVDTLFFRGEDWSAIKLSWRPFVDDRTPEEKEARDADLQRILKDASTERCRLFYCILKAAFPDRVPKSFNAFSRAKNTNSEKYQSLLNLAASNGIKIPDFSCRDIPEANPVDPDPDYGKGLRKPLFI